VSTRVGEVLQKSTVNRLELTPAGPVPSPLQEDRVRTTRAVDRLFVEVFLARGIRKHHHRLFWTWMPRVRSAWHGNQGRTPFFQRL